MSDNWLILDCNFLCRRSSYAFPDLTFKGHPTGITFGFLSDLIHLQQRFDAPHLVFCFDLGRSLRMEMLPGYKAARRERQRSPEEADAQRTYHQEIKRLWQEILPNIGYENILIAYGYEADDWIARACQVLSVQFPHDEATIVSADHDLFQLIGPTIQMFNPNAKKVYTLQALRDEYGITPADWIQVKAIAGCRGDEIPGAPRIGDATAIKYLLGQLRNGCKARVIIEEFIQSPGYARNLQLTRLPLESTPECSLAKHRLESNGWRSVTTEYGMDSIVRSGPYTGRR